jgi:hypothetical protein
LCADRKQASGQLKFTQQKGATGVRIQASLQLQAIKATDHRQTDCASGRSVELSPACLEIPVTFWAPSSAFLAHLEMMEEEPAFDYR